MVNLLKKLIGSNQIDKVEAYSKVEKNYKEKIEEFNKLPSDIKEKIDASEVIDTYGNNLKKYVINLKK